MESLSERQRLAVLLNKFEGMSYADIAETMELSLEAVKSLLSRAREKLREALEPYFQEAAAAAVGQPMSEPQKQLDPDLQEQLVAYLDGELDAAVRRRVEEMLANDPRVRRQLAEARPDVGTAGRVGRRAAGREFHAHDAGNGGGRRRRRRPAHRRPRPRGAGGGDGCSLRRGCWRPARRAFSPSPQSCPTPTGNCSKTCRFWKTSTNIGRSTASISCGG